MEHPGTGSRRWSIPLVLPVSRCSISMVHFFMSNLGFRVTESGVSSASFGTHHKSAGALNGTVRRLCVD